MKSRTRVGRAGWLTVFLLLVLAGCGKSPAVKYYTLNPLATGPADPSQTVSAIPLAIGVGPVDFPKLLKRPQIVTRSSQHRVELSEFHRWASSLSEDFLRVLTSNIAMLLPATQVVDYPWTDAFSPTYRIQLTVEQFEGRFGGDVVLNVRWSLGKQKETTEHVLNHTRIEEPVSGRTYDALVAAKSRAIGALSRTIVDEIERVNRGNR